MYERTKKINGHEYRYLVKGVRIGSRVKQVFIKYIGKVPVDPLEGRPIISETTPIISETVKSWEEILSSRIQERKK